MSKLSTTKGTKVEGAAGGVHTYTEEEKEAFVDYINSRLQGDVHMKHQMPLNPKDQSLFSAVKDGILLCKLINAVVPGSIDERVLNIKANLNAWQRNENHQLALNSAKAIGCKVVNIGADDLNQGTPHLVLGLVWQIIKIGLLSTITLAHHPELIILLQDDETLEDLFKLPSEQLLLRWVNYQLKKGGHKRQISNFQNDIADSVAYTMLIHEISPQKRCTLEPLSVQDPKERAEQMLQQCDTIGCRKFVTPSDIVNANPKLNLAFVANLFNTFPALEEVDSQQYASIEQFDESGTREERAFRFWIQSLGVDIGNSLYDELQDGLIILKVFDVLESGSVDWKRVNKVIRNQFNKHENCNVCVDVAKRLGLSTVNLGGRDIVDKNKKLVLGLVWQMMRYNIVSTLKKLSSDGKQIRDEDIIKWANDKVAAAGRSSSCSNFKDKSLKSGVFLCDLCYAVSPRSVNMELVTPGETDQDAEMNAKYAISVARKLGCAVFCLWEDIVEVNPKMIMTLVGSLMLVSGAQAIQSTSGVTETTEPAE